MTALRNPLLVDERVYLVPRTIGAPREAWRQPKCTIVRIGYTEITVRLKDGTEITTHEDNVSRRRLSSPSERPKRPASPVISRISNGYEEVALF